MLELTLVGHVGKDATINDTNGRKVINFSVAHTEKYKDAHGTPVSKTIWVECAKWGEHTGIASYLKKGTLVAITGRPEANAYMSKDNRPAASIKCNVNFIQLLSSNSQEAAPQAQAAQPTPNYPAGGVNASSNISSEEIKDDLPF
jgi:single-strand DNA-binding protein